MKIPKKYFKKPLFDANSEITKEGQKRLHAHLKSIEIVLNGTLVKDGFIEDVRDSRFGDDGYEIWNSIAELREHYL